jgi:DNA adenine methylase
MHIRPPVKWPGGKRYLAKDIISYFPPHRIYLEAFGGAGSVLLNKRPVAVEVYNDLDLRISRFFRVIRDQGDAFLARVRLIPYSQVEFEATPIVAESEGGAMPRRAPGCGRGDGSRGAVPGRSRRPRASHFIRDQPVGSRRDDQWELRGSRTMP